MGILNLKPYRARRYSVRCVREIFSSAILYPLSLQKKKYTVCTKFEVKDDYIHYFLFQRIQKKKIIGDNIYK